MHWKGVTSWERVLAFVAVTLCSCQRTRTESTSELIRDLNTKEQVKARAAAARSLGERRAVEAVRPLIAALSDAEPVRASAARSLAIIKDPQAVEPLIGLLTDINRPVSEASAHVLGELKDNRAVAPLVAALKNGNEEAGTALVQFGAVAVKPLIACLGEAEGRRSAARALARIGEPAVGPLIEAFRIYAGEAQIATARALAAIEDLRVADTLMPMLNDGNVRLVATAYNILLRINGPDADNLLRKALHEYGNIKMAGDFLRSGRPTLRMAAENWARENSYPFEMLEKSEGLE
jgi:HEAT repeat protein